MAAKPKPKTAPSKPAAKPSTALAKVPSKALALNNMRRDANRGLEKIESQDVSIPFLTILQTNSPQVKKNNEKFIRGAEPGHILDTARQVAMPSARIISCGFEKCQIEWVIREDGGGFVKKHPRDTPLVDQVEIDAKGRKILPNENQLVETALFYVVYEDPTDKVWRQAVLSMKSTQLKKARRICTILQQQTGSDDQGTFTLPSYATIFFVTGDADEQNEHGEWKGWTIEVDGRVEDQDLYDRARAFGEMFANQSVEVNHNNEVEIDS